MPAEKSRFINVDDLMPRVTIEQVAAYYGITLPELHRTGAETRARCFLACGRVEETGDRVLAIQESDAAKKWHCHQYGCGKGGNLPSMIDLIKPGESMGGRPRGTRFKEIAADIRAMVEGEVRTDRPDIVQTAKPAPIVAPSMNRPLRESDNERARALVDLDRKFVIDPALMPPTASSYFRRRPFLLSEACRDRWRVGYLRRDGGGDTSGGTMRGKVVYGYLSERGEVLTWFGRDPDFEEKHLKWEAGGKVDREPEKFHFVKGFHRGIELFGQHASRLKQPGHR